MFSHDNATLLHYKTCMNGRLNDYVIRFDDEQSNLHVVIEKSFAVFKMLYEKYESEDKRISGRLVALVNYIHLNDDRTVSYYHPSYATEVINDASDFFHAHMLKIGERMESFNKNGSHLIIKNIEEIHIHINHCGSLYAKDKYPVYVNHESYDDHRTGREIVPQQFMQTDAETTQTPWHESHQNETCALKPQASREDAR